MNIIVAVFNDWGIGFCGGQPVVIDEDRRFFRETTDGGIVIVGRRTFEAIGGPLPRRKNIVLTRDNGFAAEGVTIAHSPEDVLKLTSRSDPERLFVIGGAGVYKALLPYCGCAYVTRIFAEPLSDVFFPDLDMMDDWVLEQRGEVMESDGICYNFNIYRRISN